MINRFDLMENFDRYLRALDRERMLLAIEGRDIHIFGLHDGWKKILKKKSHVFYHNAFPFEKSPEIFRRAKCVISSSPMFKRGLHERMLLALSQGASVLCNDSLFIQRDFHYQKAILPILSPDYSKANALIDHAFANEKERLEQVWQRMKPFVIYYTWDSRARTLVGRASTPHTKDQR